MPGLSAFGILLLAFFQTILGLVRYPDTSK